MKTVVSQVKYILDGINGRLDIVDVKISEPEDIAMKIKMKEKEVLKILDHIGELPVNCIHGI